MIIIMFWQFCQVLCRPVAFGIPYGGKRKMVGVSVSAVRLYHFVLTTPGLERLAGRTKSIIGLQSHRSQNSHRILSVSSTLFFPSDGHRFSDRTHELRVRMTLPCYGIILDTGVESRKKLLTVFVLVLLQLRLF